MANFMGDMTLKTAEEQVLSGCLLNECIAIGVHQAEKMLNEANIKGRGWLLTLFPIWKPSKCVCQVQGGWTGVPEI